MKTLAFLALFVQLLYGDTTLKIASYNVENLFDLNKNDYRYKEYKPNTKSLWNKKNYKIKIQNIAKVIKEIDADIIALQEVGSKNSLKDLRFQLKQEGLYYQYYAIADKKPTATKVAILSKIPFVYSKELRISSSYKYRNILEIKINIDNNELFLFINHWKAKSGPESMRITSAKKLKKRVQEIGYDKNIVLLGDFNSDYEEYIKFKRKRKHNDTNGKTGINHILKTLEQTTKSSQTQYTKNNFYNLWYDTRKDNRYTYIYRGKKEALDNILISQSLLNTKNISYINNSISNYDKKYLFKKKNIYRWQISRGKIRKHKGKGYSDHLPIVAEFIIK